MKEGERRGRLSTLVELFPNPRRDLNGCQSFPVLGLVAREKLPSKGVKLAPVGPFRPTMRVLGTNAGFVSGLQTICTRASRNAPLSFASEPHFSRRWGRGATISSISFDSCSANFSFREIEERKSGIHEYSVLFRVVGGKNWGFVIKNLSDRRRSFDCFVEGKGERKI